MTGHRPFAELRAELEYRRNRPMARFKRFVYYRPRNKLRSIKEQMIWARQRVTRGWDDRAYWSTDSWLCPTLGSLLEYTATRLHGHPENIPYEEWVSQYLKAGEALSAYNDGLYGDDREVNIKAAQDALHWVADNLVHLWD